MNWSSAEHVAHREQMRAFRESQRLQERVDRLQEVRDVRSEPGDEQGIGPAEHVNIEQPADYNEIFRSYSGPVIQLKHVR